MRARLAPALVILLCAWPSLAGDPPSGGTGEIRAYIDHIEKVEALSNPQAGEAYALLGKVTVEFAGMFSVRARRLVIWLDPDTDATIFELLKGLKRKGEGRGVPLWAVRAIYAEGGRRPAVFQAAGHVFRSSSFYYDFQHHRGVFYDTTFRLRRDPDRTLSPDLVMRAKKLRAVAPGLWRARDVTFFSSNYQEPEVRVQASEVTLRDPAMRKALGRLVRISRRDHRGGAGPTNAEMDAVMEELAARGPEIETKKVTLRGLRAWLFKIPIIGWKKLEVGGADMLPLSVVVGFGNIGSLGTGIRLGGGLLKKPVGFLVAGGYIDGRGPLVDGLLDVDAFGGRVTGKSVGVYLRDRGQDFGTLPTPRDRFWFNNKYRWRIDDVWRLDVEYDDLSDAMFLRMWEEEEFKEGKVQETYAYLRARTRRAYATLVYKLRTIGFQDEVEELPRLRGDLPVLTLLRFGEDPRTGEPITLQLAGSVEMANLRHRRGLGGAQPDFRTGRLDVDPTLLLPFTLGPFRVVPFGTFRFTGYEEALDGGSAVRYAGSAGLRLDTQLARWFGSVRHVVNLSLVYEDLYSVTEPARGLFPMGAVDRIAPWEGISLRWRNRLLRRTGQGMVEFFSLEILGAWFPEGEQPLGEAGDWYLEVDWEWLISRSVWMETRLSLDPERGDTGSLGVWWKVKPNTLLQTSFRHLEGDSDILTFAGETMVDTRWRLVGFSQWDLRNQVSLDQGVLIQRVGNTVVIGFRGSWDPGPDGFRFSVTFDLLEAFLTRRREERDTVRHAVGWK